MDVPEIQAVLMIVVAFLLFLPTIQPPLLSLSLKQRIFPNFHGSIISGQPWLFWRNTGETPGSFWKLANDLLPSLSQLNMDGGQRIRQRRQKLGLINQLLLVMIWLRKYPHLDLLSLWFDIDPSSVVRTIHRVLPLMWQYFRNQIVWPNPLAWNNMMGSWPEFPNVVGAIDSSPHEIYRPSTEPQRLYNSGHRHYHCMNTQMIIDNEGRIRFLQSGFLGSTHDALSFRLIGPIGALPANAKLLADRGYPDGGFLLTPKDELSFSELFSLSSTQAYRLHKKKIFAPGYKQLYA
ncbi:hypothetical protein AC249_AIPGENE4796 [Exaiptasia diaphana]|nr:hypothetical protein AC249_AIPGENE4796 [Exaiptasia diaphana]